MGFSPCEYLFISHIDHTDASQTMKRAGVTERIPPRDGAFKDFFYSQDLPDAVAGIRRRGDVAQSAPAAVGVPPVYVVMPAPSTPKSKGQHNPDTPPFHPQ